MAKEFYKLRDPGTMFRDPGSEFTITGGEVKELPPNPSHALRMRIRKGVLVRVDQAPPKAKPPEKRTNAELIELLGPERAKTLTGKETKADLLELCEKAGITE